MRSRPSRPGSSIAALERSGCDVDDVEVRNPGRANRVPHGSAVEDHVGDRRAVTAAKPQPARCIGLRIEVDQQHPGAAVREACGEVDRRRGLPDAALLIRDRVDHGCARCDAAVSGRVAPARPPREPRRRRRTLAQRHEMRRRAPANGSTRCGIGASKPTSSAAAAASASCGRRCGGPEHEMAPDRRRAAQPIRWWAPPARPPARSPWCTSRARAQRTTQIDQPRPER